MYFANQLIRKGADSVILISAGIGRTSVRDWAPDGRLNSMLRYRLSDAKNNGLDITDFFWHQGETDNPYGKKGVSPEVYKQKLVEIIKLTREYFPKSNFYVALASRCGAIPPSKELQSAQIYVTGRNNIFIGPNTDELDINYRFDDCHFTGQGLIRHGDLWLQLFNFH